MITGAPAVCAATFVFWDQPLNGSQQPCSRYSTGHVWVLAPAVQPGGSSSSTWTVVPTAGELIVMSRVVAFTWSSAVTDAPSAATPGNVVAAAVVAAAVRTAVVPAVAAVPAPAASTAAKAAARAMRVLRIRIASILAWNGHPSSGGRIPDIAVSRQGGYAYGRLSESSGPRDQLLLARTTPALSFVTGQLIGDR